MKPTSSIKIALQRAYARGYVAGEKNAMRKVRELLKAIER